MLKSWAVTRGPSLIVGEKRLAVRTEDHPMEYLDFEGNIPKGEYGGGAMIVWDRGRWEPRGRPRQGARQGPPRHSRSHGDRLKGRWHLVRMRPRRGEKTEPWLLIKADDEFARQAGEPDITDEETTSFLSGRTTDELAAAGELRKDHAGRAKVIAGAQDRRCPTRRDVAAPAKASCRPSSSRACRSRPTRRRAARSGCTRSNTTATACRRASTGAMSGCSRARARLDRAVSEHRRRAAEARAQLRADRRRDRRRGCRRHPELHPAAGGPERGPQRPLPLFRCSTCSIAKGSI